MEESKLSGLKREDFQSTIQGKQTDLFTLVNKSGNEVCITNYGGALVAIICDTKKCSRIFRGNRIIPVSIVSQASLTAVSRTGVPDSAYK